MSVLQFASRGHSVIDEPLAKYDDLLSHSQPNPTTTGFLYRLPKKRRLYRSSDDYKPRSRIYVSPCEDPDCCPLCRQLKNVEVPPIDEERNVDSSPIDFQSDRQKMQPEQWAELWDTTFGNEIEVTPQELHSWFLQTFRRYEQPIFGIRQIGPGPCGLLSAVQAFVIAHFFFSTSGALRLPAYLVRLFPEYNFGEFRWSLLHTTNCCKVVDYVTAEALGFMIFQANHEGKEYKIVSFDENVFKELLKAANDDEKSDILLSKLASFIDLDEVKSELGAPTIVTFNNISDVVLYYYQNRETLLFGDLATFSFLLSLVMNRGCRKTRLDSDLGALTAECDTGPMATALICKHGHTAQEVVNLAVIGAAISNLQDGESILQDQEEDKDKIVLKGVHGVCSVGHLSVYATAGFVTLGDRLKFPLFPIWVCSDYSHYRVVYSPYRSMSSLDNREKQMGKLEQKWKCYDKEKLGIIEVGNDDVVTTLLDDAVHGAYTDYHAAKLTSMVKDGILLKADFMNFCSSHFLPRPGDQFLSTDRKYIRFPLYIYDGQFSNLDDRARRYVVYVGLDWLSNAESITDPLQVDPNILSAIRSRWTGAVLRPK